MVATTAFVLGFVVVGLATLFVAMGRGPKGARNVLHAGASPRGSSVSWGIAVVAAVIGLGIPALILAHNSGAQEKQGPGGVDLTASEIHGRQLFAKNCATCHTLAGAAAVGKVGPNLDEMRPPKALVANAIAVGRAQGQGQMPSLLLTGNDARDVAEFVDAVAGR
jgi:mono/diheme cytochrome c family protein